MKRSAIRLAGLVLVLRASLTLADSPAPPTLRLPSGAAPTRYGVELWIDPARETFRGKVEIRVSLKEESGTLWLSGKELTVEAASAVAAAGPKGAIKAEASAEGKEFIRLQFEKKLPPGEYDVSLTYEGRIESKGAEAIFREKRGATGTSSPSSRRSTRAARSRASTNLPSRPPGS